MWSDFESDIVEGRYPLGKLVRSEGRCGWFETQFDGKAAIISLIESINDEAMLLERLRAAQKISSKNVMAIFEAAATTLRKTPLVYAVMEYTEENLEDVLRTRALSAEETREVAGGLLDALYAIHKDRLVCGRLEAASVLASGDTIKLRSDYLQLVAPGAAFEPYAANDVRDLGSLVHQCLTQRALKRATDGNDPSLQLLPSPFVQIVRSTLTGYATLDGIAALLRPAAAATTVQPTPAQPPVAKTLATPPTRQVVEPKREVPVQPKREVTREVSEDLLLEDEKPSRRMPLLIGGFVVLLLLVGFVVRALLRSSDHAADAPPKIKVVVAPEKVPPPKASAAVPVPAAKPKAPPAPVTASPSSSSVPAGAWRVVAYTYNREDQAEHKAQTINERHPDLAAGVFSPKGSGAPYLVTLGTPTDRASAFRLREKAVHQGLPNDTYAQNYTR